MTTIQGESYTDNLDTSFGQVLGRFLGGVASDSTDFEFFRELRIGEKSLDDGTTLITSGAKDSDQLGHSGGALRWVGFEVECDIFNRSVYCNEYWSEEIPNFINPGSEPYKFKPQSEAYRVQTSY